MVSTPLIQILRRPVLAEPSTFRGLAPVLARVYATRSQNAGETRLSLEALPSPDDLLGIEAATDRLIRAVRTNEAICVAGDFDCDGATATAVCVRALRAFGHGNVSFFVPDRARLGYGLTPGAVDAMRDRKPGLILTVDNGISSAAGVAHAREAGIDVIVTDHHLPPDRLPPATATVNPNQPGDPFPSKALAGVGVAFYLMLATRQALRKQGHFHRRPEPNLAELLDLVALGTVADMVPLDHTNRILVEQGLRRIRAGHASPGIAALLQVSGCNATQIVASDFGFGLGPRLNAAGRLETMDIGIQCLLSDDPVHALEIATRLDALNRERRKIGQRMREEAEAIVVEQAATLGADLPDGLCLFAEGWHQGVVGLVAGRIKDRFHRPVVAFAEDGNTAGRLKGSARSIPGVHIRDALARVDALQPGLIERFGGHAMAAGLTLHGEAPSSLERFRDAFTAAVSDLAPPGAFARVLETDGPLDPEEMSLDTARMLRYGGPWGQGFPEPIWDGPLEVTEVRWVGDGRHAKLRVRYDSAMPPIDAIAFNATELPSLPQPGIHHLAYRLDVNHYKGISRPQLVVQTCLPVRQAQTTAPGTRQGFRP